VPPPAAEPLPVPEAATPAAPPAAPPWPSGRIGSLPLPRADSGEGILSVNASPWATVHIDGLRAGDTPREWRLPAGRHRLRAAHPGRVVAEIELEVRAGERRGWQPRLTH
jgi:hypothetical protein